MTEPFEDIVRDALRGTSGAADEMPTYHGAWQRGRRRRLIKRSALVATGAFVLLAALTVNLGRLPGSEPIETSDVATGAAAAVAATPIFEPTTLETTAPVETPSLSDGDTDSVPAAPTAPTASVVSPAETPTAVPQAAEPPAAVAQTTLPQTAVPQTVCQRCPQPQCPQRCLPRVRQPHLFRHPRRCCRCRPQQSRLCQPRKQRRPRNRAILVGPTNRWVLPRWRSRRPHGRTLCS